MNVMTSIYRYALALSMVAAAGALSAQNASTSSGVRRVGGDDKSPAAQAQVSDRMQMRQAADSRVPDDDAQWMKVVYRSLDLAKVPNASLYYPQEVVDGQENLFRIIMRLLANNQVSAYEYLDGREVFSDQYKIKVRDMLDRFHILYTDAKGSTERNPRFTFEESDVPANEVLSYYVIERWEFDTRSNSLKPHIEAVCPVLHRSGDFGGEPIRYPMFWIKFNDIRPWLAQQQIFTSDDNNLPSCNYDDFFNLTMYDGEIYKTRNLKNRSMLQIYPDDDSRKRAQDSIQASLDNFDKKLWVPSREEVIAAREAREAAESGLAANDSLTAADSAKPVVKTTRSTKRSSKSAAKKSSKKVKEPKQQKAKAASTATRSVRNRRR